MYHSKPGLLIGFHGCERTVRDNIVEGKLSLKPSENGYDWLGVGFYFWENNFDRALDFAQNPPGKKKYKNPAVLGAVLDLGYCLDLLDTQYLRLVKDSYKNFVGSAGAYDREMPQNKILSGSKDKLLRELDCAVIENLHLMQQRIKLKPFDSVRGVFVEGEELYPGAGFHDKNHIQICVRNPNCIKGFFIPRQEVDWKG
jgi:hypothetical protein